MLNIAAGGESISAALLFLTSRRTAVGGSRGLYLFYLFLNYFLFIIHLFLSFFFSQRRDAEDYNHARLPVVPRDSVERSCAQ